MQAFGSAVESNESYAYRMLHSLVERLLTIRFKEHLYLVTEEDLRKIENFHTSSLIFIRYYYYYYELLLSFDFGRI